MAATIQLLRLCCLTWPQFVLTNCFHQSNVTKAPRFPLQCSWWSPSRHPVLWISIMSPRNLPLECCSPPLLAHTQLAQPDGDLYDPGQSSLHL